MIILLVEKAKNGRLGADTNSLQLWGCSDSVTVVVAIFPLFQSKTSIGVDV